MLNKNQLRILISNLRIKSRHSCWLFDRKPTPHGYGQIGARKGTVRAHRALYEFFYGRLNSKKLLHHICENKMCANPSHLKPMTQREHGLHHRPKFCKNGHPMKGENVMSNWKQRYCRECHIIRRKKYRLKLQQKKLCGLVFGV